MNNTARLSLLLLIALPTLASAAGAEAPGPSAVIRETVDEVIAALNDDSVTGNERARRIEQIAYARFDFEIMSRLVVARNWKQFDAEQKTAFQNEFKRFLANSYRARIDGYEQEKVDIVSERQEPRGDVTVRTRIVGGEYDGTNIDYRLRNRGEGWLVIDVVIEGISLVSNYRDQFKEVLASGGPDELVKRLAAKNAEVGTSATGG
jgi:phospholipid transport system substrate-binding protein